MFSPSILGAFEGSPPEDSKEKKGRNDLTFEGKKISGSAFKCLAATSCVCVWVGTIAFSALCSLDVFARGTGLPAKLG